MSKERRLGRGLEALLGGLPGWNNAAGQKPAGDTPLPAMPAEAVVGESAADPQLAAIEPQAALPAHAAPSIEEVMMQPQVAWHRPSQEKSPGENLPQATPSQEPAWQDTPSPEAASDAAPLRLEIDQIASNPAQPRQDFNPDELKMLSESIAAHGLLQPVVVRRVKDRYELIAGERRLQAAKRAGWSSVPVNIVEADDRQTAELAIIENLHRKDLNALEKAASFHRYLDHYGCTQEELAGRLNLDRSTIANLIRLLELPEAVQDALRRGKVTQGHARAMLPLGDEREQVAFCERIQKEGLSVRQTEAMVQEIIDRADREPLSVIGRDGKPSRVRKGATEHVAALEQQIRSALGTRVKLTHDAHGKGKLVIHFQSHEEFERIRQQICARRSDREAQVG